MENEFYHHGIKDQKWGIRRYQNKDGSLTPAGIKRYGTRTNYEKVKVAKKAASPSVMRAKKRREKAEARTQAEIAKYKKKAGVTDQPKSSGETSTQTKTHTSVANSKPKAKSISEMSTDELRERTNRMNAEKDYIEARNKLSSLQPKQKAKGSEFVKSMANEALNYVLVPAVLDVGKQAVKSYLVNSVNKKFDLDDELKVYTNNKKK